MNDKENNLQTLAHPIVLSMLSVAVIIYIIFIGMLASVFISDKETSKVQNSPKTTLSVNHQQAK